MAEGTGGRVTGLEGILEAFLSQCLRDGGPEGIGQDHGSLLKWLRREAGRVKGYRPYGEDYQPEVRWKRQVECWCGYAAWEYGGTKGFDGLPMVVCTKCGQGRRVPEGTAVARARVKAKVIIGKGYRQERFEDPRSERYPLPMPEEVEPGCTYVQVSPTEYVIVLQETDDG